MGPRPLAVVPPLSENAGREAIVPLPLSVAVDEPLARLGAALFSDTIMSEDGKVSCASCHRPEHGMADGRAVSVVPPREPTTLNATTLYNVRFFPRLTWTGRFPDLGAHLDFLVVSQKVLGSSWEAVAKRLTASPDWSARFRAQFKDGVSVDNARAALVEYERSLVTPGAPFDRWLGGDRTALSDDAVAGYGLFSSYGCVSCHQGIAIGANLYQRLGVMGDYFAGRAPRARDLGRYEQTRQEEDRHVFRVPSLRNVALTAPYLHDGTIPTLPAVVNVMADAQLGVVLAPAEVSAITAFLESLTGDSEALLP